jgi:hypothetical protein
MFPFRNGYFSDERRSPPAPLGRDWDVRRRHKALRQDEIKMGLFFTLSLEPQILYASAQSLDFFDLVKDRSFLTRKLQVMSVGIVDSG